MTHEFKVEKCLKEKWSDWQTLVSVRLSDFTDGMVHISELAPFRVERISDIIKEGMRVPVKVISVDPERGKVGLSIREANKDFLKIVK